MGGFFVQLWAHPAWLVAITVGVLVWLIWAAWRRLPYAPRRRVPWQATDIVLVLAAYLVLQSAVIGLTRHALAPETSDPPRVDRADEPSTEHVVARLMSEGGLAVVLLCVVSAAVVAPVAEEFFFRVLLQSYLEKVGQRWRRRMPILRQRVPRGLGPAILTSVVFAGMHFRLSSPPGSSDVMVARLTGDAVARCLTVALAITLLRWRTGATAADFGWAPKRIVSDVQTGLGVFAAIVVPIYAMQIGLHFLLKDCLVAPDPLPLFFLALMLAAIFYRTHRLVPLVVLHAALNATSLLFAGLGAK